MTTFEKAQLSPLEEDFAPESAFRNKWQDLTEKRRIATHAARSVLRAELDGITWDELRRDPTRGELAARLYSTWTALDRSEPIVETDYSVTGIYADLTAAMAAHGLSTFEERCAELGKRMVEAAIEYILDCHASDYEALVEDWNAECARRREDAETAKAEAWYAARGLDP